MRTNIITFITFIACVSCASNPYNVDLANVGKRIDMKVTTCIPSPDVLPKLKNGHGPIYPASQIMKQKGGKAKVVFDIDKEGNVSNIKTFTSDYPYFAKHVKLAANTWFFEPALNKGKPVEVRCSKKFLYKIDR